MLHIKIPRDLFLIFFSIFFSIFHVCNKATSCRMIYLSYVIDREKKKMYETLYRSICDVMYPVLYPLKYLHI